MTFRVGDWVKRKSGTDNMLWGRGFALFQITAISETAEELERHS